MQTATVASTVVIGGISFNSGLARQAEGNIGQIVTLPAGVAGAVSPTGVDGLATGHGFQADDVIDVHWTDPTDGVSHKCRRGVKVDTASANAITFDNSPAAEGDALPAEDTAVVVARQVSINTDFDGDDVVIVGAKADQRAMVDFRSAAVSLAAKKLAACEAFLWASNWGFANPLAGDPVDVVKCSNGTTTSATLYLGLLYDSV